MTGSITDRTIDILQLLERETDDKHPLNATEIKKMANAVKAYEEFSSKAAYRSMNILRFWYPEIQSAPNPSDGWFMQQRYTVSEALMSCDIVGALRFLKEEDKRHYRKRILERGYPCVREAILHENDYCVGNDYTYACAEYRDIIATAIRSGRRLSFYYTALDPYMHPIRKHDGKCYCISPYDCFYGKETFYVTASEEGERHLKLFRLDRMEMLTLSEKKAEPVTKYAKGKPEEVLRGIREECVDFFCGEKVMLELEVYYSPEAMNIVYDLAGKRAVVTAYDEEKNLSKIRVPIRFGTTLTGWLIRNQQFLVATGPEKVVESVQMTIRELCRRYGV